MTSKVKLGEICEIHIGKTPSRANDLYWNGRYNWLSIADLTKENIVDTKDKVTDLAIKECQMKPATKGTVVMSFKLTLGKTAILTEDIYTNEAIANFVIKNENVLQYDYLYYSLQAMNFELTTDRAVMGKTLNKAKLKELSITIPDIFEQHKIVNKLKSVEKVLTLRNKQLQYFDNLVKSRFNEMFGEYLQQANSKLGDFITLNPSKKEVASFEGDVSFIPMANVSEFGEVTLTEVRQKKDVVKGFTYFRNNDVLLAKITPCFENGKGAVVSELINGIGFGSTEFHVLRGNETVNSLWLYYLTMLPYFRMEGERKMAGSAGQKRVTKDFIEKFKVTLPPLPLQEEFAHFVEAVDKSKLAVKQSLDELETLKKKLMQDYFG